ncbi:hypothetical protein [Micavibrio aeruginosavorus]|uniref:hypothetical protein n=1 Tax=Micavibrio aeruginosavorus TaxID=349221 RepID=UPI003F4AD76E
MVINNLKGFISDGDATPDQDKNFSFLTVKQFSKKHPAFPEGGIRHLIFYEKTNGFNRVIRRVGRRVLLDENAFFRWVEEKNTIPQ